MSENSNTLITNDRLDDLITFHAEHIRRSLDSRGKANRYDADILNALRELRDRRSEKQVKSIEPIIFSVR